MRKIICSTFLFALVYSSLGFGAINFEKQYNDFKVEADKKIQVIDRKLETVKGKLSTYSGEAKAELQKKYDDMLEMKKTLVAKVEDAKDSAADQWESTRDKIEDYADDLESKIDKSFN